MINYRPHPKDGGRYCFQFVCQFTPRRGGGGTPARSGWWGVPQPGLDGGGREVPQPGLYGGRGVYPIQVGMVPGLDGVWGVPQPGLDCGGGYPGQAWMVGGGYPS